MLQKTHRRLQESLAIWGLLASVSFVGAEERQTASIEFFERKIRPVLVDRCYECHSSESDLVQGGLRVDNSIAMKRGGDSGNPIAPGEPKDSLLISVLRYDAMEMPPDEPLPERVIKDFEDWIRSGAAMPEIEGDPEVASEQDGSIDWSKAQSFWAFQPPERHSPDEMEAYSSSDPEWEQSKLDGFILGRLAESGLKPNSAASRRVWLRRVTFDLTGLPPTPEQFESFERDQNPFAKERVVDRLLASPQHAERWARLWLDVARYAEDQAHIVGNNDSLTYPNAYLYRDWVIKAFAEDIPFDDFVRWQLAADLIAPDQKDQHAALGFLGLGPKYYRRGDLSVMADEWEDRVDTVSRGLLGLTVACARCHDHKYDPVSTSDYYGLAGIFASTEMFNRPLDSSVEQKGGQAKKPLDAMHIVREGSVKDLNVMIRGDAKRPGAKVQRGFLTILNREPMTTADSGSADQPPFASAGESGRRELAEAIVDRSNPLTARVIVNRVWHQLMGKPLVATPSNFGSLGGQPSHPLLLDDLSVRFMQAGWSLKWLQREIVLSSTYGQSSEVVVAKAEADPENRLLWRMPRRRLSVESYRDAVLLAAGNLEREVGGRSIDPQQADARRRTVYSKVSRLDLNPMLARFDFPDPNAHSPARHETTSPLQKLFLLNSPFLVEQSARFADVFRSQGVDDARRIHFAYRQLFGRQPTAEELRLAEAFVAGDDPQRWNALAQSLLISNEMFVLD